MSALNLDIHCVFHTLLENDSLEERGYENFKHPQVVILVIWRISDTWDILKASYRSVINVSIPSKEILRYFRITEIIFLVCVLWCLNNIIGLRIRFRDKLSPLPHCPENYNDKVKSIYHFKDWKILNNLLCLLKSS